METGTAQKRITLAFINNKSLILDVICNELVASGTKVLFRSENIDVGLSQLSVLKELPKVCMIDLDFYGKNVLAQLQKLRIQYPTIKLIAHSDIDAENLLSNEVTAKSSSGSGIKVHPIVSLDAKASSGSDIKYYNNPKTITKATSSGGSVSLN